MFSPVSPFLVKQYKISIDDTNSEEDDFFDKQRTFSRWIVIGVEHEYVVSENYCNCISFQQEKLKIHEPCKHMELLETARKNNTYDSFLITTKEYEYLRSHWLHISKSR